jgi:GT2 family glycosyltransferase
MLSYWTSHADRNLTLVGATRSSLSSTELTYGGFDETSRMKLLAFNRVGPIDGVTRPCDTFNGNFVIVGGQAMTAVGGFSKLYVHGFGDLDLGLRLKAYGCPPEVYYEYIGVCDRGPTMATMVKRKAPRERIKALVYRQYGIHQEIYFGWQHRPKIMLPAYFLLGLFRRIKYVLG